MTIRETITVLFGLFGGLALFLFGMNSMSEALQKAAGEKMRAILGFLTRNPIMGALAGALVTAILQSSSATTVMAIGFVSAGLMGLPQAISVIFGANIGTTMTAQLIAFDISDYIYPIIFIGFLLHFVSKNEKIKNIGMVIFSFGLLFEGIEIMGSVMKPLAGSPVFTELMAKVSNIPVFGVALGLAMTLVVQSSSATIAVLQSFASQAGPDGVTSVIGLAGAIPILLGDNIGTTITALLASIGQSRDAKRTAVAHSCFNISGSLVFIMIIPQFARFIQMISPKGPEVEVISRQIANAHTTFNVVCTLIWLPLLPFMVKLVRAIVPENAAEFETAPVYTLFLDRHMVAQPAAALYLVSEEIENLTKVASKLFPLMTEEVSGGAVLQSVAGPRGKKTVNAFDSAYENAKSIQTGIINYISEMFSSGSLSQEQSEEAAGYLAVVNDVDRVSERCREIVASARAVIAGGQSFSGDAVDEIKECIDVCSDMFEQAFGLMYKDSVVDPAVIMKAKRKMRKAVKQFGKAHLARVKAGKCAESMTGVYAGILYNLDRISDNCVSVAEEALNDVNFA